MTGSDRRRPCNLASPVVGGAVLLGLLALGARAGMLHGVDAWCGGWMAALRAPVLDQAARGITFFGSSAFTLAALPALALVMGWRAGRGAAVRLAGAFAVGVGLEMGLRLLVAQWRPDTVVVPLGAPLWDRFELAGFPSGHAYRSAFVWGGMASQLSAGRSGKIARAGCVVLIILVGVTRVYLNRHWASDVAGGWLVALVALGLSVRHLERLSK